MIDYSQYKIRNASYKEVYDCCKHDQRLLVSKTSLHFALDVAGTTVAYVSGYVTAAKNVFWVTLVYSLPECRSKGYGSFLLSAIVQKMRETYDGIKSVKTCALLGSVRFYARLGFKVTKTKHLKLCDVVYMEKVCD